MTVPDPLELLAALTDHVGQWGPMATDVQWADATAVLDLNGPRRHWQGRAKGYSKTRDVAATSVVALLTQFPQFSDQKGYVAASDTDQATLVRQSIQAFVDGTPELAGEISVEGRKIVATRRGTELHILAADKAGSHGLRPCWLVLDELANWPDVPSYDEIFGSYWAGLAKTGGRGIIISTAGSPSHFSRRVFEAAQSDPMWRVSDIHGPPPWMPEAEVESERRSQTPSRFARWWMNEWAEPDDALVSTDDLAAAAILDGPIPPSPGVRYCITLDVGIVHDRTVVVVAHREGVGEDERVIVDRLWRWQGSRRRPVDLREVEETIVEAHARYPGEVVADPYQAIGLLQSLTKRGIGAVKFDFTVTSVGRLARSLLQSLRSRRLTLPNDPVLLEELASVRIVENSAGTPRLDHLAGKRDDQAVAIALAVHRLTDGHKQPPQIIFAGPAEGFAPDGSLLQVPVGPGGKFAMSAEDAFFLDRLGDGSW